MSDEAPAAIASASGTRAWRLVLPLVVATLTPGCARAPEPPKDDEAMVRARCNRPEDIARGCTPLTPEDAARKWFSASSGDYFPGMDQVVVTRGAVQAPTPDLSNQGDENCKGYDPPSLTPPLIQPVDTLQTPVYQLLDTRPPASARPHRSAPDGRPSAAAATPG